MPDTDRRSTTTSNENDGSLTVAARPATDVAGQAVNPHVDNHRITDHGFAWVGQPMTSCEDCGKPLSDHDGVAVTKPGAGPFGDFEVVTPEEAARRMPLFGHYAGIEVNRD